MFWKMLNVMSADCFFCPTNSPELKDSFTITNEKEKQQIFTLKKLEAGLIFLL